MELHKQVATFWIPLKFHIMAPNIFFKSDQIKSNFICTEHFITGGNTMRLTVVKKWGGANTCKDTQIFQR